MAQEIEPTQRNVQLITEKRHNPPTTADTTQYHAWERTTDNNERTTHAPRNNTFTAQLRRRTQQQSTSQTRKVRLHSHAPSRPAPQHSGRNEATIRRTEEESATQVPRTKERIYPDRRSKHNTDAARGIRTEKARSAIPPTVRNATSFAHNKGTTARVSASSRSTTLCTEKEAMVVQPYQSAEGTVSFLYTLQV